MAINVWILNEKITIKITALPKCHKYYNLHTTCHMSLVKLWRAFST